MKRMRVVRVMGLALAVVLVGAGMAVAATTYFWRGDDGVGTWEEGSWVAVGGPCYPGCNGNTGDDAIVSTETTNEITIQEDNTIDDLVVSKNTTLTTLANAFQITLTLDSLHISARSEVSVSFIVLADQFQSDLTVRAKGFNTPCG